MKKVLFIARQLLISIVFLQLLNLSICSESYVDYNLGMVFNYSTSNNYDPTETIVEWVVEWKKGNIDAFTYKNDIGLKGISKNFAWHIDMQHGFPLPITVRESRRSIGSEIIKHPPTEAIMDILSPPPEHSLFI